jgi:hypothetical protein
MEYHFLVTPLDHSQIFHLELQLLLVLLVPALVPLVPVLLLLLVVPVLLLLVPAMAILIVQLLD